MRTVLYNCGPIVTFDSDEPLIGHEMSNDKWILSAGKSIIVNDNKIEDIQDSKEALDDYESHSTDSKEVQLIDVDGRAVIPGLIDSHTHLVWAGDRSREVRLKLQGKSYSDIAKMGGGINSTVSDTRQMSELELFNLAKQRAITALNNGTTFMETKTGYGLNNENELKLLSVAKRLNLDDMTPGIDSTWLGAHAIPQGHDLESYTYEIINSQLPAIAESGLARSADVFCEPGWFSLESTESLLKASMGVGLSGRLHIDEFVDGGGASLAAELGVVTADHALKSTPSGRQAMADAGVITGYLPGTPHTMNLTMPSIADTPGTYTVASDFNPNCPTLSLPFAASLAVHHAGLTPAAALAAVTTSAAQSVSRSDGLVHGELSVGAAASLNVLGGATWESWCLSPGHDPFSMTVVDGIPTIHENTLHPCKSSRH